MTSFSASYIIRVRGWISRISAAMLSVYSGLSRSIRPAGDCSNSADVIHMSYVPTPAIDSRGRRFPPSEIEAFLILAYGLRKGNSDPRRTAGVTGHAWTPFPPGHVCPASPEAAGDGPPNRHGYPGRSRALHPAQAPPNHRPRLDHHVGDSQRAGRLALHRRLRRPRALTAPISELTSGSCRRGGRAPPAPPHL